jgi:Ni2+-binding GTPase involved in maturation of urease and hydrogenase
MERDARQVRNRRPFLFTNCRAGAGLRDVCDTIEQALLSQESGVRSRR